MKALEEYVKEIRQATVEFGKVKKLSLSARKKMLDSAIEEYQSFTESSYICPITGLITDALFTITHDGKSYEVGREALAQIADGSLNLSDVEPAKAEKKQSAKKAAKKPAPPSKDEQPETDGNGPPEMGSLGPEEDGDESGGEPEEEVPEVEVEDAISEEGAEAIASDIREDASGAGDEQHSAMADRLSGVMGWNKDVIVSVCSSYQKGSDEWDSMPALAQNLQKEKGINRERFICDYILEKVGDEARQGNLSWGDAEATVTLKTEGEKVISAIRIIDQVSMQNELSR
jgi:hypothetical protein